jgi:acetate kinase
MCAIVDGRSIATTMGFSTADGLVMGTRTGSIDPGALIALMRDDGMSLTQLEDLLYRRSGLLRLSGLSSDMRTLLASDRPEAKEAIEYHCYSAARYAGSLITAMGGVDAMVFTGGIGEHAAPVRGRIVEHLAWLGLSLDETLNKDNSTQIMIHCAKRGIYVVPANEELTMARHSRRFCF